MLRTRAHSPTPVYSPHYQPTQEPTYDQSNEQTEDMTQQLRRVEVVTTTLDREIARLKAQLEALDN